jgi:hypothetical protein
VDQWRCPEAGKAIDFLLTTKIMPWEYEATVLGASTLHQRTSYVFLPHLAWLCSSEFGNEFGRVWPLEEQVFAILR